MKPGAEDFKRFVSDMLRPEGMGNGNLPIYTLSIMH